jgi:hypothetical protein
MQRTQINAKLSRPLTTALKGPRSFRPNRVKKLQSTGKEARSEAGPCSKHNYRQAQAVGSDSTGKLVTGQDL